MRYGVDIGGISLQAMGCYQNHFMRGRRGEVAIQRRRDARLLTDSRLSPVPFESQNETRTVHQSRNRMFRCCRRDGIMTLNGRLGRDNRQPRRTALRRMLKRGRRPSWLRPRRMRSSPT